MGDQGLRKGTVKRVSRFVGFVGEARSGQGGSGRAREDHGGPGRVKAGQGGSSNP